MFKSYFVHFLIITKLITVFDVVWSSLSDRYFVKLGGGLDKGDFYFKQI